MFEDGCLQNYKGTSHSASSGNVTKVASTRPRLDPSSFVSLFTVPVATVGRVCLTTAPLGLCERQSSFSVHLDK